MLFWRNSQWGVRGTSSWMPHSTPALPNCNTWHKTQNQWSRYVLSTRYSHPYKLHSQVEGIYQTFTYPMHVKLSIGTKRPSPIERFHLINDYYTNTIEVGTSSRYFQQNSELTTFPLNTACKHYTNHTVGDVVA